jgi:hypothetical protein
VRSFGTMGLAIDPGHSRRLFVAILNLDSLQRRWSGWSGLGGHSVGAGAARVGSPRNQASGDDRTRIPELPSEPPANVLESNLTLDAMK